MQRELIRLIAGQVFLHACMAGMRMAMPLLALQQGFSALAVGALLALFAITQVFFALPAGRYADRKGLKKPILISVVLDKTHKTTLTPPQSIVHNGHVYWPRAVPRVWP